MSNKKIIEELIKEIEVRDDIINTYKNTIDIYKESIKLLNKTIDEHNKIIIKKDEIIKSLKENSDSQHNTANILIERLKEKEETIKNLKKTYLN